MVGAWHNVVCQLICEIADGSIDLRSEVSLGAFPPSNSPGALQQETIKRPIASGCCMLPPQESATISTGAAMACWCSPSTTDIAS